MCCQNCPKVCAAYFMFIVDLLAYRSFSFDMPLFIVFSPLCISSLFPRPALFSLLSRTLLCFPFFQVYHLECLSECFGGEGFDDASSLGSFICPWHQCWTCCKRISSAGGVLFRCADCPTAYCFDCLPDDRTPADATPQQIADFAKYVFSNARISRILVCLSTLHTLLFLLAYIQMRLHILIAAIKSFEISVPALVLVSFISAIYSPPPRWCACFFFYLSRACGPQVQLHAQVVHVFLLRDVHRVAGERGRARRGRTRGRTGTQRDLPD